MRVLIAFHSDYGNTEQMARAVAAGIRARAPETEVELKRADEAGPDDLVAADVILFGTPVHMGGPAWQLKRLIDACGKLWMEGALEGKVGGAFATGGGYGGAGGGVELTLAMLHSHFLEQGMVVVGFPKTAMGYADGGLQWGPYARTGNHEGMPEGIADAQLTAARSWGAHVIEVAEKLLAD